MRVFGTGPPLYRRGLQTVLRDRLSSNTRRSRTAHSPALLLPLQRLAYQTLHAALTVAVAKLSDVLSYAIVLLASVVSSPLMEHIDHIVKTFGADFSFRQNCSPHSVYVLTFLSVLSQPPPDPREPHTARWLPPSTGSFSCFMAWRK